jgi:hypothetical protein
LCCRLRDKDGRLQEKILELSREHKQVKVLANQVANLVRGKCCGSRQRSAVGATLPFVHLAGLMHAAIWSVLSSASQSRTFLPPTSFALLQAAQLKAESARASLLTLASDHGLAGPALGAEVDKLVRLGLKAPNDFWERLMSERSQVIIANSNRHGREKVALERKQAQLQVGGRVGGRSRVEGRAGEGCLTSASAREPGCAFVHQTCGSGSTWLPTWPNPPAG